MATTNTITENRFQPPSRRIVRAEYTHTESDLIWQFGPMFVLDGTDVQADLDARAEGIEEKILSRERTRLVESVYAGTDPADLESTAFTRAEIDVLLMKRTCNLVNSNDEDKAWKIDTIAPWMDQYSDTEVATAIDWTVEQVADVRAQITAHRTASDGLGHEQPRFEGVD
jgi:hypothetical protein